jgi:cellulose synthase/poly-beta-1,6-N-acetylglucosamine synthase-like glycosyltransferase
MPIVNILEILMWMSFLVIFLFYTGYLVVLYFFRKKGQENKKSLDFFYPEISLIVPVYNEEKIIDKKIQNIEELMYPNENMEVVFVDGRSTDRTVEIIKDSIRRFKRSAKLIEQERRMGYTHAMIQGILNSTGEIIVMTDAASYHYPEAIMHLVKHFRNHEVGAVTGKEIVLGDRGKLGPSLEENYRVFYDFMREAETEMDSTPDAKGEILAVRKDVCNHILPKLRSPNASFDSCVPFQAKLMGYRTIYEPEAKYYECAPSSFMDRMKQQTRRATVLLGALLLFKGMPLRGRYGKFGLIILPVHFAMQCLLPWVFLLGVGCLLVLTFVDPLKTWLLWVITLGALAASRKSRLFLVSFVQSQIALLVATFRLATRRESLFIDTIPSTRGR